MKNKIFFTLFAVVAFFSFTTFTFGQQKKSQNVKPQEKQAIEIKDDRFSGDRTVTLTQKINDTLQVTFESKFNTTRPPDLMERDLGPAISAEFTSSAKDDDYSSNVELIFLVDGKRTKRHPGVKAFGADRMRGDGKRTINAQVSLSTLEQIANGKKVEMKLGTIETTLDEATLKNIKAFAAALAR